MIPQPVPPTNRAPDVCAEGTFYCTRCGHRRSVAPSVAPVAVRGACRCGTTYELVPIRP